MRTREQSFRGPPILNGFSACVTEGGGARGILCDPYKSTEGTHHHPRSGFEPGKDGMSINNRGGRSVGSSTTVIQILTGTTKEGGPVTGNIVDVPTLISTPTVGSRNVTQLASQWVNQSGMGSV